LWQETFFDDQRYFLLFQYIFITNYINSCDFLQAKRNKSMERMSAFILKIKHFFGTIITKTQNQLTADRGTKNEKESFDPGTLPMFDDHGMLGEE